MNSFFSFEGSQLILRIAAQPKSSKTGWGAVIEKDKQCWLQLKLSSPPVDGAANKEAIKFIAKFFKVSKSSVTLLKGERSRLKTLKLEGVNGDKWKVFMQEINSA